MTGYRTGQGFSLRPAWRPGAGQDDNDQHTVWAIQVPVVMLGRRKEGSLPAYLMGANTILSIRAGRPSATPT